jgi:arginyl-tRNA synthetase
MKEYLQNLVVSSLSTLGISAEVPITFEKPRQAEHGDLTTNIAMVLGKRIGRNPRQLADDILSHMVIDSSLILKAETAGPGFINIAFTDKFYRNELKRIVAEGGVFGRGSLGKGKKAQVEFVSANPTGPLTVGHGRNAVVGDTVANLLEWVGYDITREYYFNNAGRQMRILGDSVRLRYLELLGDGIQFPEEYYQGEYIREIARHLLEQHGSGLRTEPPEGRFKAQAEQEIFDDIKRSLKLLGIGFQSYFNESSLYESGKIQEVIEELRARGLAYESEGALWFKASAVGGEKDKVIVKGSGEPTYRLPDIAYHREKFRRGYDLMVDILGSDHVATYPDVLAGLSALGLDAGKVKVLIHQFVTIVQNGEVVKMSTRKANFITLDELIDEVGADVVRYFFLMRSATSHLNFDLGLAKQRSDENPVYYLQYAHARICSILRYAEEEKRIAGPANVDLLSTRVELDLIKLLLMLPEVVESSALAFEPHRLTEYLHDVGGAFHRFYHECRVVTEEAELTAARLALCLATKTVLANGLRILGISAPEKM